jgi:hypothetical protein
MKKPPATKRNFAPESEHARHRLLRHSTASQLHTGISPQRVRTSRLLWRQCTSRHNARRDEPIAPALSNYCPHRAPGRACAQRRSRRRSRRSGSSRQHRRRAGAARAPRGRSCARASRTRCRTNDCMTQQRHCSTMNSFSEYTFRAKVDEALTRCAKFSTRRSIRRAPPTCRTPTTTSTASSSRRARRRCGDGECIRGVWCEWCGARRHAQLGQSQQSENSFFFFRNLS